MDWPAVAIRFATYANLSLIAGVPLFLCLSLGQQRAQRVFTGWRGPFVLLLAAAVLLSLLGLLSLTAMMAGTDLFPVDGEMVGLIVSATAAGKAIVTRAVLAAAMIVLLISARAPMLRAIATLGAITAMTLVWNGHAAASEGMAGWLHFAADALHILAATLWIGGMACLLLTLRSANAHLAEPMLHAFTWIGGIIVALLIATGIFNTVMIIGLDALTTALGATYGKLLLLKVALFLTMLALAANNRFRLTPAFERDRHGTLPALRRAIFVEIALAAIILALVAWLGMIAPLG